MYKLIIKDNCMEKCKMFGGEKAEQYNTLMQALIDCSEDENQSTYEWIDKTSQTSLVVFLIDKINELGFELKAKTN